MFRRTFLGVLSSLPFWKKERTKNSGWILKYLDFKDSDTILLDGNGSEVKSWNWVNMDTGEFEGYVMIPGKEFWRIVNGLKHKPKIRNGNLPTPLKLYTRSRDGKTDWMLWTSETS